MLAGEVQAVVAAIEQRPDRSDLTGGGKRIRAARPRVDDPIDEPRVRHRLRRAGVKRFERGADAGVPFGRGPTAALIGCWAAGECDECVRTGVALSGRRFPRELNRAGRHRVRLKLQLAPHGPREDGEEFGARGHRHRELWRQRRVERDLVPGARWDREHHVVRFERLAIRESDSERIAAQPNRVNRAAEPDGVAAAHAREGRGQFVGELLIPPHAMQRVRFVPKLLQPPAADDCQNSQQTLPRGNQPIDAGHLDRD